MKQLFRLQLNLVFVALVAVAVSQCQAGATVRATPLPSIQVTPHPLGNALIIAHCSDYGSCAVRAVDAATGSTVESAPALQVNQYFGYAFSSGNEWLALNIEGGGDGMAGGQLHLIDLMNWRIMQTDVAISGWTINNILAFSPDDRYLALTTHTEADSSRLAVWDVTNRAIVAQADLNFVPWVLHFAPDSARLTVYGSTYDSDAPPTVTIFALPELDVIWSATLESVRDGLLSPIAESASSNVTTAIRPAVVASTDGNTLFIVHGDEDRLTKVSLDEQTTRTINMQLKSSWIDSLMALGARTAYAKVGDESVKRAVLSPDGRRLYVVASSYRWSGQTLEILADNRLQTIDPVTGNILKETVTNASAGIGLMPLPKRLVLTGWTPENTYAHLLDPDTLQPVVSLTGWSVWVNHLLNGSPVLLGYNDKIESQGMAILDPATLEIVAMFEGNPFFPARSGWMR